jgi:putative sigma-54 modulation protein
VNLALRGRNIEVTPALRAYVARKLERLDKYFDQDLTAQVAMSVEKGRHIVEMTIPIDSLLLRGEEETEDMYASVDLAVDKLERQIHKLKTRLHRKLRRDDTLRVAGLRSGDVPERPAEESPGAGDEEEPRVVRTKRFALKPMTVDEAIVHMELLGHDFFVFRNAETEQVNVVYRRRSGNYGLIEPQT